MTLESAANGLADAFVKLLKALTIRRLALLSWLALIGLVLGFAYDSRDYIRGVIQPAKFSVDTTPLELTDLRAAAADAALKTGPPEMSTVVIASVNAPANTRRIIYFRSTDRQIQEQYDKMLAKRVAVDVPLFTSSTSDNATLFRLLNGELVCRPWAQSISSRYLQGVNVKQVCAVGVPPGFSGRFRGIVFIYLRTDPDEAELHRIHIMLRNLSFRLDGQKAPYSEKYSWNSSQPSSFS